METLYYYNINIKYLFNINKSKIMTNFIKLKYYLVILSTYYLFQIEKNRGLLVYYLSICIYFTSWISKINQIIVSVYR